MNLFKKVRAKETLTAKEVKPLLDAIDRFEHLTLAIMKRLPKEENKLALKDYKYIQSLSKKSDK